MTAGKVVSAAPRSTPAPTTWMPSNTWNTAAMGSRAAAMAITAGSCV